MGIEQIQRAKQGVTARLSVQLESTRGDGGIFDPHWALRKLQMGVAFAEEHNA
jgi:hypothetical protein